MALEIKILDYGDIELESSFLVLGRDCGRTRRVPTLGFVILGGTWPILVDTGFGGPPPATEGFREPQARTLPNRVYPTLEAALARFRFMPPQGCENPFIADFIARRSLRRAPLEGGGEGWTWRFDPLLWSKLDRSAMEAAILEDSVTPIVHVLGSRSKVIEHFQADPVGLLKGLHKVIIPDSAHHVMVDQPLALVAAIRALLIDWP